MVVCWPLDVEASAPDNGTEGSMSSNFSAMHDEHRRLRMGFSSCVWLKESFPLRHSVPLQRVE
jgi:hypothetical protein